MIERYSREEMGRIWDEDNRLTQVTLPDSTT